MTPSSPPPADSPSINPSGKIFHCGPLSYTGRGLLVLFGWLLWGDFCFTLMEAVVPSILPLKLKALEAPNWVMAVILTTLPGVLNMTVCPWVSFKSDRYRSRWGRRIPFILGTLPLLCLSLLAMGWTDDLSRLAYRLIPATWGVAPVTLTVLLLGLFMVMFSFFNMFVSSVFWYLFNDVVPSAFLGRFFGLFRIVGNLAAVVFNLFVYQYAEIYMREILTGTALLYFFGFGVVCLKIKEGPYPPPPETPSGSPLARLFSEIRTFSLECYTNRFYWYFYLATTFAHLALVAGVFMVFFYRNMGLDLRQIGILSSVGSVASLIAMYVAAIYVDRWHPLRITVYIVTFSLLTINFANWIWVPVNVPPGMFFWLSIGMVITSIFSTTLIGNSGIPAFMRLLPPSRYGQFCSGAALVRSAGTIIAGLLAGAFLDGVKWCFNGSDFAYRFIFVWGFLLNFVTCYFYFQFYRKWKQLGGDTGYHAPAPWLPEGVEDMSDKNWPLEIHHRWLLLALRLFTVGFTLHLLALPIFIFLFHQRGMNSAVWWFAWVFTPLSILMIAIWIAQVRSVTRDVAAEAAWKIPLRYGIPHHGVMMVMAIQGFFVIGLLWLQLVWTLRLNMERELIWFGASMLTTLAPNLLALHMLRLLERPSSGSETRTI